MNKFKPGDRAWSPYSGFGTCIQVGTNKDYLEHGSKFYKHNGEHFGGSMHPVLLTIEEAAKLGYYPPKQSKTIRVEDPFAAMNYYPQKSLHLFLSDEAIECLPEKELNVLVKVILEFEIEE